MQTQLLTNAQCTGSTSDVSYLSRPMLPPSLLRNPVCAGHERMEGFLEKWA